VETKLGEAFLGWEKSHKMGTNRIAILSPGDTGMEGPPPSTPLMQVLFPVSGSASDRRTLGFVGERAKIVNVGFTLLTCF
jgi:hypothetical protein